MNQVRDDSSSLFALRDSVSVLSRYTDALSKLSLVFAFDAKILGTKVYQRIVRGSWIESIRLRQADNITKQRSRACDRSLHRNAAVRERDAVILLAGQNAARAFTRCHAFNGSLSREEIVEWRLSVKRQATWCFWTILDAPEDAGIDLEPVLLTRPQRISKFVVHDLDIDLDADAAETMANVYRDSKTQDLLTSSRSRIGLSDSLLQ